MYVVLYNPLSRSSKKVKDLEKLLKKENKEYIKYSVLEKLDLDNILGNIENKIIIVGGDGTLNVMFNYIRGLEYHNEVYLFRAGTGNDFARSFKGKLMNVTDYVKRLPSIKVEDKSVDRLFLNGCGMGVDGLVCKYVNVKSKRSKLHFLKSALKAFFNFKKINVDVNVDGKEVHFKNVWLCCVMNGPYEGGGMKMSPNSNRLDDDLEVVVVHSIKSLFIAFVFPIIYLGWHINLKRYVYTIKGKNIEIKSNVKTVLQYDGETIEGVNTVKVSF